MFLNNESNSIFLEKFKKSIERFFKTNSISKTNFNVVKNVEEEDYNTLNSNNFEKQKNLNTNTNNSNFSTNTKKNKPSSSINRTAYKVPTNNATSFMNTGKKSSRVLENSKQQVVSITYEEIGLFPRSFNRVFDRFFKQLFFDVDNLVIQEYRFYRYLFLTTVKCVFILLFVPLTINFFAKNYFVRPITEYYWNTSQSEIFLNSYQQKRAFTELQEFEEKIYFESLILSNPIQNTNVNAYSKPIKAEMISPLIVEEDTSNDSLYSKSIKSNAYKKDKFSEKNTMFNVPVKTNDSSDQTSSFTKKNFSNQEVFSESVQNRLHEKILELAIHYNEESIEAITNFFADLISFSSLCYLFFALEIQINITKSFLLEVFFGLDDSKKSLFILFVTDLLVGYHSPNIWELFFSSFFDHYGLPENQTTIFLLVATLPVLLDVLFKYLIFRHLNRASPATVATYHAMIE
jgi:hypothetical protein